MGSVELHPFLAYGDRPEDPTAVVFDLDRGPGLALVECAQVSLSVREVLLELGVQSFPKTSGWHGLHVYVPLNAPHSFADTKAFARGIARRLAERDPAKVVDVMARSRREGKVFVDWGQNDPNRSTIAPYSLRATPSPGVSMPLTWDEVDQALEKRRAELLTFRPDQALDRVAAFGDVFGPVLELRQTLPPEVVG